MPATSRRTDGGFCPESITGGVDWITFITDDRKSTDSLVSTLEPIARGELGRGEKRRPFRFMKWRGEMAGAVRLGIQGDTAVAQLSGDLCASTWTHLRSLPGRVTRLDLQTTLRLSTPQKGFARSLLRPSEKTRQLPPQSRVPTSYSSDTRGLRIGTVGLRTNRRYLRVYDKGREADTHPAGTLWRVELEAKRDLAPKLWNRMRVEPDAPMVCYESCARAWRQSGYRWPLPRPSRDSVVPPANARTPAPAHALAAWLRTSVAPAIPRILAVYSTTELLDMLGLSHLATERNQEGSDA